MIHVPFEQVRQAEVCLDPLPPPAALLLSYRCIQAEGLARPSFTLSMIRDETTLNEELVMKTSGAACQLVSPPTGSEMIVNTQFHHIVVAGAETTSAFVQYFIYAMLMYPEVQKKAQDELDRVVGINRLPTPEE